MKKFPVLAFKYEKMSKTVGEIWAMYQRSGGDTKVYWRLRRER